MNAILDISKVKECPFCHKRTLKIDSKSSNAITIVGGYKASTRLTASIRCTSCHARGPTASELATDGHHTPPQTLIDKVIDLWNSR